MLVHEHRDYMALLAERNDLWARVKELKEEIAQLKKRLDHTCATCLDSPENQEAEIARLRNTCEEYQKLVKLLQEDSGKLCDWCEEHFVSDRDTVGEEGNSSGLTHWICDPCQSKSDRKFFRHRHVPKGAGR